VTGEKEKNKSSFAPFAFTILGLVMAFSLLLAGAFLRNYKLRKLRLRLESANANLERKIQMSRAEARELIENPDYVAWVVESELGLNQADEVTLLIPGAAPAFMMPERTPSPSIEDKVALLAAPLVYDSRVRFAGLVLVFTCLVAAIAGRGAPVDSRPQNT